MVKKNVLFFAATLLLTFAACHKDDEPSNTNGDNQPVAEKGTLSGAFSVSEQRQVYFAKGNLLYNAKTQKWQFAEHQYDVLGQANADISDEYEGLLDLFGFGTSGLEGGHSPLNYLTGPGLYASANLVDTQCDWAENDFVNIIKEGESWVTLTQYMWNYLLTERENAAQLAGFATVVDVKGLILLPDT